MTEDQIVTLLIEYGFIPQSSLGWRNINRDRPRRLRHPSEQGGSLYAAPNFLAATGPFKKLREQVIATGHEREKYPYWQGPALAELLQVIASRYSKA